MQADFSEIFHVPGLLLGGSLVAALYPESTSLYPPRLFKTDANECRAGLYNAPVLIVGDDLPWTGARRCV
jgi:hypothetical protein